MQTHIYTLAIALTFWATAWPGDTFGQNDQSPTLQWIEKSSIQQLLASKDILLKVDELSAVKTALWTKFKSEVRNNKARQEENKTASFSIRVSRRRTVKKDVRSIEFNGKIMRFSVEVKGEKPDSGYALYISLHGGGRAPDVLNNQQWISQMNIWNRGIEAGIYVVPRGIDNTYNLHSMAESYAMYDRIIENMIAFEDVDPNKVYVLGFSAGGDGVYQITARMPDRFAAANMMAGHPNGISVTNYRNVPFLIQMGEKDTSYNRHKTAANYDAKLNSASAKYGGFVHDTFLHPGGTHNSWMFNSVLPDRQPNEVFANPAKCFEGDKTTVKKNTDSIAWLSQHTRNPYPTRLLWDQSISAQSRSGIGDNDSHFWMSTAKPNQFYWLEAVNNSIAKSTVDISYDRDSQSIRAVDFGEKIRLLIHEKMMDLSRPISIYSGESKLEFRPKLSLHTMIRTLIDRGDINFVFPASVVISKTAAGEIQIGPNLLKP